VKEIVRQTLNDRKSGDVKVSQFDVPAVLKKAFYKKSKAESVSMSMLINVAIEVCDMSGPEAKKKLKVIKTMQQGPKEHLPLRITPENKEILLRNASALKANMTQLIVLLISKCILIEE